MLEPRDPRCRVRLLPPAVVYGAKEYVWLNGGPDANGLGPDGEYFFAVLVPGGQPNPNDGGLKNLSDDYDCYKNRQFTITNGEVSFYDGYACGGTYPFQSPHWLDSGRNEPGPGDPIPNGLVPYIRLFPYADTTNPGGVYIMAICYIGDGSAYPVEPRDCKYDAFKVKKQMTISFFLDGIKFLDVDGDGTSNGYTEPGLEGWKIIISGTGPDGQPINAVEYTDVNGYWSYSSPEYRFSGSQKPVEVSLTICEDLPEGWIQTFPGGNGCHTLKFTPTGFDSYLGLDFGNGMPAIDVEKTCTAVVPVGTPIEYDLDVKNTGNVNLVNVDLKDATLDFDNDPNLSLIPGGTGHYDLSITPTTPQVIKNTVKATGDYGLTTVFATVGDKDTCTTNVVDARISIVESDTNGITEPHTFTVTLEKNDGSGWVPAKNVIVTVTETGVGEITAETCTAETDATGSAP